MKKYLFMLAALLPMLVITSCRKDIPENPDEPEEKDYVRKYVNTFAYNMMKTYYLWTDEISGTLENWKVNDDPFEKIEQARYKDSSGKDIDRWTQLTDDYKTFTNSVEGTSTTYGFDFVLYYYDPAKTTVCAVVTLVYPDSPAAKAGLKRGDCIIKIAGGQLTPGNYAELINAMYSMPSCTFTLHGGATVTMSPVEMYEEPVLLAKTFDCSGKKVGYLLYNSFTQQSALELVKACKYFKAEGVDELILDLRYNGGGYTNTELALASMLAPKSDVEAGHVFETEVYNKAVAKAIGKSETVFTTDFSFRYDGNVVAFSTADANLELNKIYALVTSSTASASESIIGGLRPYIKIDVIGSQTHGKFCSGIIESANEWYESVKDDLQEGEYEKGLKYADNWGIYLMIGRYADKDGKTISMPNGIIPDISAEDCPDEGLQLGDPEESMLSVALQRAGYVSKATASVRRARTGNSITPLPDGMQPGRPAYKISNINK